MVLHEITTFVQWVRGTSDGFARNYNFCTAVNTKFG